MAIQLETKSDSRQAQNDLKKLRMSVDRVESSASKAADSIATIGTVTAGAVAGALAVQGLTASFDKFTNIENRLKSTVDSMEAVAEGMRNINIIAGETGNELQAIAGLYTKVSLAGERFGASQQKIAKFTRAVNQSLVISGATAQEAQSALLQLGQGLAANRFAGEELRAVFEAAPKFALELAKGMNVPFESLRKLAEEGKLTFATVFNAINKQADSLNDTFNSLNITYSRAFTNLGNAVSILSSKVKKALFGTGDGLPRYFNNIAISIIDFAENLEFYILQMRIDLFHFKTAVQDSFGKAFAAMKKPMMFIIELVIALNAAVAAMPNIGALLARGFNGTIDFFKRVALAAKQVLVDLTSFLLGSTEGLVNGFAGIISRLTSAAVGAVRRIFSSIPVVDVMAVFPGLDAALDAVVYFATKAERAFFWLFDQVIGHSWIPDLVEGTQYWCRKLLGDPLKSITSFTSSSEGQFAALAVAALGAMHVMGTFRATRLLSSMRHLTGIVAVATAGLAAFSAVDTGSATKELVATSFKGVGLQISQMSKFIADAVAAGFKKGMSGAISAWNFLAESAANIGNLIRDGVVEGYNTVVSTISSAFTSVADFMSEAFKYAFIFGMLAAFSSERIKTGILSAMTGLFSLAIANGFSGASAEGEKTLFGIVTNAALKLVEALGGYLKKLATEDPLFLAAVFFKFSLLFEKGRELYANIFKGLVRAQGTLGNSASQSISKLVLGTRVAGEKAYFERNLRKMEEQTKYAKETLRIAKQQATETAVAKTGGKLSKGAIDNYLSRTFANSALPQELRGSNTFATQLKAIRAAEAGLERVEELSRLAQPSIKAGEKSIKKLENALNDISESQRQRAAIFRENTSRVFGIAGSVAGIAATPVVTERVFATLDELAIERSAWQDAGIALGTGMLTMSLGSIIGGGIATAVMFALRVSLGAIITPFKAFGVTMIRLLGGFKEATKFQKFRDAAITATLLAFFAAGVRFIKNFDGGPGMGFLETAGHFIDSLQPMFERVIEGVFQIVDGIFHLIDVLKSSVFFSGPVDGGVDFTPNGHIEAPDFKEGTSDKVRAANIHKQYALEAPVLEDKIDDLAEVFNSRSNWEVGFKGSEDWTRMVIELKLLKESLDILRGEYTKALNLDSNPYASLQGWIDQLPDLSDQRPKYATGGHVSGAGTGTSDSIPAMLSNGEYVINAAATSKYRSLLDRINYGGVYAETGISEALEDSFFSLDKTAAIDARRVVAGFGSAADNIAEKKKSIKFMLDLNDGFNLSESDDLEYTSNIEGFSLMALAPFNMESALEKMHPIPPVEPTNLSSLYTEADKHEAYESSLKKLFSYVKGVLPSEDMSDASRTTLGDGLDGLSGFMNSTAQYDIGSHYAGVLKSRDVKKRIAEEAARVKGEKTPYDIPDLSKFGGPLSELGIDHNVLAETYAAHHNALLEQFEGVEFIKLRSEKALSAYVATLSEDAISIASPALYDAPNVAALLQQYEVGLHEAGHILGNVEHTGESFGAADKLREELDASQYALDNGGLPEGLHTGTVAFSAASYLQNALQGGLSEQAVSSVLSEFPEILERVNPTNLHKLRKSGAYSQYDAVGIAKLASLYKGEGLFHTAPSPDVESMIAIGEQLEVMLPINSSPPVSAAGLEAQIIKASLLLDELARLGAVDPIESSIGFEEWNTLWEDGRRSFGLLESTFGDSVKSNFRDFLYPKDTFGFPQKYATGGHVSGAGGPTDDLIPAMLSNGEYVVNAASTGKFRPVLDAINNGTYGKLSTGTAPDTGSGTPGASLPVHITNTGEMANAVGKGVPKIPESLLSDATPPPKKGYWDHFFESLEDGIEAFGGMFGLESGEALSMFRGFMNTADDVLHGKPTIKSTFSELGNGEGGLKDAISYFTTALSTTNERLTERGFEALSVSKLDLETASASQLSRIVSAVNKLNTQITKRDGFKDGSLSRGKANDLIKEQSGAINDQVSQIRTANGIGGDSTVPEPAKNFGEALERINKAFPDLNLTALEFSGLAVLARQKLSDAALSFETTVTAVAGGALQGAKANEALKNAEILRTASVAESVAQLSKAEPTFANISRGMDRLGIASDGLTKANDRQLANVQKLFEVAFNDATAAKIAKLAGAESAQDLAEKARLSAEELQKLTEKIEGLGAAAKRAGEEFAAGIESTTKKSLSDLLKGKIDFGEFADTLLDRFTSDVIDKFVDGFVSTLFDNFFDDILSKIGSDQFALGGEIAGMFGSGGGESADTEVKTFGDGMLGEGDLEETSAKGFKGLGDIFSDVGGQFMDSIEGLGGFFSEGLGSLSKGLSGLFSGGGGGGGFSFSSLLSFIPKFFSTGGPVIGPGSGVSDSIPAMLSNGEYVINASQTARFKPLLAAINEGRIGKFAKGGMVGAEMHSPDTLVKRSSSPSEGTKQEININITGDISRQTRSEIFKMLPDIASGVNMQNRENGYRG
ncbi:tape measure protein [bacterium]|nr:tape measure protein [bacterium]